MFHGALRQRSELILYDWRVFPLLPPVRTAVPGGRPCLSAGCAFLFEQVDSVLQFPGGPGREPRRGLRGAAGKKEAALPFRRGKHGGHAGKKLEDDDRNGGRDRTGGSAATTAVRIRGAAPTPSFLTLAVKHPAVPGFIGAVAHIITFAPQVVHVPFTLRLRTVLLTGMSFAGGENGLAIWVGANILSH